jgi:aspartate racemase
MEQDFYKGRLATRHGLEVLVPEAGDRAQVHRSMISVQPRMTACAPRATSRAMTAR